MDKLFYNSLGLEHFTHAFSGTDRVKILDISENDIGSENFLIMLPLFESNVHIENLNIADCQLDGECVGKLCVILKEKNKSLRIIKFRNSELGDTGASAIADLISCNMTIVDLEIFNCSIAEKGGNDIGSALKTNFCIEKLSIGSNLIEEADE